MNCWPVLRVEICRVLMIFGCSVFGPLLCVMQVLFIVKNLG